MALFTRGDRAVEPDTPRGLDVAPFAAPPAPATLSAPHLAPPTASAPLTPPSAGDVAEARRVSVALVDAVEQVMAGRRHVAEMAAACLFSRGHLLIEDIPGVGKTLLAQAIAAAVGGTFHRIQGTSDLLPGDVTGALVPDHDGLRLRFRPGPVFANVVVFDELNRTNPRTQSALLEAAEEATVTVDGTTHELPDPFFLVATQNPIEIAGTFRLGEGALDRFAAVITPGRAGVDDEVAVLAGRRGRRQLHDVVPVTTVRSLAAVRDTVDAVAVSDPVARYVVDLLEATRHHPRVRLGASTRGGLSVVGLARAYAVMRGRSFVVPDDVAAVVVPALSHRVLLLDGNGATTGGRDVVLECVDRVRPPTA